MMLDWSSAIPRGAIVKKSMRGREPVVLYRGANGDVLATPERCAHRGASLTHGTVDGDCVRCGYHARLQAPSVNVIEKAGVVWFDDDLGVDPLIPPEWTDPNFHTFEYTRRVEAAADVMMENLLDWEHVNSVHAFALERGEPEIVMWGADGRGYARYEYEHGLVLENEFAVPYTNVLRFIKGKNVFVLWTSISPVGDAERTVGDAERTVGYGAIDLHFRVSRNSLRWIPDAAFRLMNDFVLDEDRRIVKLIPPNFRGALSDSTDGFIAMYRAQLR